MNIERALKLSINVLLISFVVHFLPITWVDAREILVTAAIAMAILMIYELSRSK